MTQFIGLTNSTGVIIIHHTFCRHSFWRVISGYFPKCEGHLPFIGDAICDDINNNEASMISIPLELQYTYMISRFGAGDGYLGHVGDNFCDFDKERRS